MIEMDQIDKKAASSLDGYLVRKDLVRTFSRQFPVPTYVVKFLLSHLISSVNLNSIMSKIKVVLMDLVCLIILIFNLSDNF